MSYSPETTEAHQKLYYFYCIDDPSMAVIEFLGAWFCIL